MDITFWYHLIDVPSLFEAALVEGLNRAKIRVSPPATSSGSGILFFSEPGESLCEALCAYSHNGLERVLAVCLAPARLSNSDTWRLLDAGAADVLVWRELPDPIEIIRAKVERWDIVDGLVKAAQLTHNLVGRSRAWVYVLRKAVEMARFSNDSVLILGESGTGKGLIARLIHALDARPDKRQLVILDCTTVVPELAGSEFFGHEKGAFTNAIAAREGAFALADRGTLFLDEIGELPIHLQAELLRVVEEKTYKRVGSNSWKTSDFRLICATNRELLGTEGHQGFRADLYYRIAGSTVRLPPLSTRREDILPLARHFLRQYYGGARPPELDLCVSEYLVSREYRGNVRELRHLVHQIAWRHVGPGPITCGDVPENERLADARHGHDGDLEEYIRLELDRGHGLKEITRKAGDMAVRIALMNADGNVRKAAGTLGVTNRAIQMRHARRNGDGRRALG